MNRSKRSLSIMLLLSFLASPICGAAENLAVMAQPVLPQYISAENSLKQNVLNPGVRALKKKKAKTSKGTKHQESKSSGGALASIAKYAIVGGAAAALGCRYHEKLEEVADYCMGGNSENNLRERPDPLMECNASAPDPAINQESYGPRCLDPSLIRFARLIGIRGNSIYYAIKNAEFSEVYDRYRKDFVPTQLKEILGPYMDINNMSEDLRYILINELATTMILLDYSKYKTYSNYYSLVFPFTLIRIYNLTNVFNALKEYGENEFTIDIDSKSEKRTYHVIGENKNYDLEKNYLIDLVFGGRIWEKCTGCRSGSPQFEDKSVDLCVYYPLLKDVWTNINYYKDPNETHQARFYRAALREDRERYMTRDFVKHPLTLNLLKHVKTLRFDFRTDSFRIATSYHYTDFVNL